MSLTARLRPTNAIEACHLTVSIVYAAIVGALMLWAGPRDEPLLYIFVIAFWVWAVLPAVASLLIGYGFRSEGATSALMAATTAAISAYGGYAYFSAFYPENLRSTSGLVFVFVPLVQWLGLALALAVTWIVWLALKMLRR